MQKICQIVFNKTNCKLNNKLLLFYGQKRFDDKQVVFTEDIYFCQKIFQKV